MCLCAGAYRVQDWVSDPLFMDLQVSVGYKPNWSIREGQKMLLAA